jgi:hypothetical protein
MFAPDCKLSKHTVLQSRRQPRWEAPACSTVSGGSHAYDRTTQWKRESVGCGNGASHCNMGDGRNAATGRDEASLLDTGPAGVEERVNRGPPTLEGSTPNPQYEHYNSLFTPTALACHAEALRCSRQRGGDAGGWRDGSW